MEALSPRFEENSKSSCPPGKPGCAAKVAAERNNESFIALVLGWRRFRTTKAYDLLAASPLIVWYGLGLHSQLPLLHQRAVELGTGDISSKEFLQFAALIGSAAFSLVAIYFLATRSLPLARSKGALPRVTAIAGSFLGSSVFFLPAAHLTLAMQTLSNTLIFAGCGGALFVLLRLGRAFSMLPEARKLDTGGPYAIVRHPLYVCETLAYLGLMLQFQQPWALFIMLVGSAVMGARAAFEERVLEAQFPQYASYRAHTSRFVPGVY
jgi:protein-S-isoprenylcysteine O-methyltransferase Ste14